jgi:chromatin remodeling complex protein RSC6
MADGKKIVDPTLSKFYEAIERTNTEKIAHETLAGISEGSSDSEDFDVESGSEDFDVESGSEDAESGSQMQNASAISMSCPMRRRLLVRSNITTILVATTSCLALG